MSFRKIIETLSGIDEDFYKSLDSKLGYLEIFKQPTADELNNLFKQTYELRFIFNPMDEKFYVWDARLAVHEEVCYELFNEDITTGWIGRIRKQSTRAYTIIYADGAYDWLGLDYRGEIKNLNDEERNNYSVDEYEFKETPVIVNEFEETYLYKILASIGIKDIRVERWS